MSDLALLIGGVSYGGWTAVRVVRSLEQLASTFAVDGTERWNHEAKPLPIHEGDAVEVTIDEKAVVRGWVDDVEASHTGTDSTLSIAGRCRTGDLVDCAVERKGSQWRNVTLQQLAEDVCKPFGVPVRVIMPPAAAAEVAKPFRVWAVQDGETAYELLERAARARRALLLSDGGDLVIGQAAGIPVTTELVAGENIREASRAGSWRERFSRYSVVGQAESTDETFGAAAAKSASVDDASIGRYRPTRINAEAPNEDLKVRAEWERTVRYGRSLRVTLTVDGWSHAAGLWAPNQLVRVRDRFLQVDAQMLVVSATLSLDGTTGETTQLELLRPEAYSQKALPTKGKEKAQWFDEPARGWVRQ